MKKNILLILWLTICLSAQAQEVFTPIVDTIPSKIYGENRRVLIFKPSNINEGTKLSVIYTLSSDSIFIKMAQGAQYAQHSNLPPTAVVAVDYFRAERKLDKGFNSRTMTISGEGEKFYRYLNEELIPHIDTTLFTSGFNTIAGYQNTATYLSTYLARNNTNFSSYILIDPTKMEPTAFPQNFINQDSSKIIRIAVEQQNSLDFSHYAFNLANIYRRAGFGNTLIDTLQKLDTLEHNDIDQLSFLDRSSYRSILTTYDRYIKIGDLSLYANGSIRNISCWDFLIETNNLNTLNYKQPLPITASNIKFLLGYAKQIRDVESIEHIINYYRTILSHYDNPEAVTALAEELVDVGMVRDAEKFFNRAIELFNSAGRGRYAIVARIGLAYDLLAARRAQYDSAWAILDEAKQTYCEDSLIYGYYQGLISAQYGYNIELGEGYLIDVQNNIEAIVGTFISEDNTRKYLKMIKQLKKQSKK